MYIYIYIYIYIYVPYMYICIYIYHMYSYRVDYMLIYIYIYTYIYIYIHIYIDIALWCKNQIEHSIWDKSLLFSNCARSLEYSSSSTLAGLSYHICGKLEVAFKCSPSSQHQHCTDEAQKAETVLWTWSLPWHKVLNAVVAELGIHKSND